MVLTRLVLRLRHRPRTLYGWLPRDKGVGDVRRLVGCGHVFGVWIAVFPRALMNVRVRLGSLSMARTLGGPVRTGCPCLVSVRVPSSHFALAIASGPLVARGSLSSSRPPGLAGSQHGTDAPRHAVGPRDGHDLQRLFPKHPPSQSSPGSERLRAEITLIAPRQGSRRIEPFALAIRVSCRTRKSRVRWLISTAC
jgi:hypothetical protein